MKDEIKEILDRLFVYRNENDEMKYQPEDILTIDDVWSLLDYITNLQNKLEEKTYLYNKLDTESKYVIINLQKRIDKAIKYLEQVKKDALDVENEYAYQIAINVEKLLVDKGDE